MKLLSFICCTAAITWLIVGLLFAFGPQSLAWLGELWTPLALVAWVCVTLINILDWVRKSIPTRFFTCAKTSGAAM